MSDEKSPFSDAWGAVFKLLGLLLTAASVISLIVQGFDVHLVGVMLEAYERYLAVRDFVFSAIPVRLASPIKDAITLYLMGAAAWRYSFMRLHTVYLGPPAPEDRLDRFFILREYALWPKSLFRKIAICFDWRISWPIPDMEESTAPHMVADFAKYTACVAIAVIAFFVLNTISSNYGPLA
ncbi:MAG: hypothetical protein AAFV38_06205 [Pseudomonadota bacterium]